MVTRFAPFKEPEFEYMESYLEDMASKGLLLDHYGMVYAYFNEGEPCQRRYRIVPKIQRAVTGDETLLYEDAGWHYAGKRFGTGLNIFYTDDPDAPEIFTDMDSFRMYAGKYAAAGIVSIICMLILLFNPFNVTADLISSVGVLHFMEELGILLVVAFVLTLLLMVVVVEAFILSEFSTMYRILAAKPIRHDIEYKSKLRFNIVTFIAIFILAAILIIGQSFIGTDSTNESKMKSYDGSHPVSYEIIDPEGWSEIETAMETWEWKENVHFGVYTKNGMLFNEKVEVHTDINMDTYMRAIYGVAKSDKIAEKWLEEEILYDTDSELSPEDVALNTPEGLDYLGFHIDEWDGQIIYMRIGNAVERISYYGDKDIMQYIDVFAEDIAE